MESYDSIIGGDMQWEFRNNHSKVLATLVITRGDRTIFEENVWNLFTQASAMRVASDLKLTLVGGNAKVEGGSVSTMARSDDNMAVSSIGDSASVACFEEGSS